MISGEYRGINMMIEDFITRLDRVRRTGEGKFVALCPAHQEKTPSLQIRLEGHRIMVHCFGCGAGGEEVCRALGLRLSDLFTDERTSRAPPTVPTAADIMIDEIAQYLALMEMRCDSPTARGKSTPRQKFHSAVISAAEKIYHSKRG
jgi:hypothetical protein